MTDGQRSTRTTLQICALVSVSFLRDGKSTMEHVSLVGTLALFSALLLSLVQHGALV